jgi:hypothetical protein
MYYKLQFTTGAFSPDDIFYKYVWVSIDHDSEWLLSRLQNEVVDVVLKLLLEPMLGNEEKRLASTRWYNIPYSGKFSWGPIFTVLADKRLSAK